MATVVVFGGTGFLGRSIVEHLTTEGPRGRRCASRFATPSRLCIGGQRLRRSFAGIKFR